MSAPLPPMRVAFAGTPAFAAGALSAVLDAGHELPLVLTQPDRPAGRGMKLQASEVKQAALARGLSVLQPRSLKLDGRWPDDARQARAALLQAAADVLVVAAYGLILPPWTLELPRHGCLNIHASLLPRWRGAAPIQRAVQAGDTQTGITIMQMDAGLDTGDILLCRPVPISAQDTAGSLHDRLAAIGAEQIVAALHRLALGELTPTPQPAQGVTIAPKIAKAEAAIDWSRPAPWIERTVRAFDPFPGAHFSCQGQVIKLWRAATDELAARAALAAPGTVVARTGEALWVACGEGVLRLTQLQAPGGKRLPAAAFLGSPLGRTLVEGVQL